IHRRRGGDRVGHRSRGCGKARTARRRHGAAPARNPRRRGGGPALHRRRARPAARVAIRARALGRYVARADTGRGGSPEPAAAGRRALDAGASTGGFTDCLLQRGVAAVVAVDVGHGQLAWSVRTDPRVTALERTNVRALTAEQLDGPVDLAVADLSFISLTTVAPALVACTTDDADLVLLCKPQFEAGRA